MNCKALFLYQRHQKITPNPCAFSIGHSHPPKVGFSISHLVLTRKRRRTQHSMKQIHFITLLHSISNTQPFSDAACSRLSTPFFILEFIFRIRVHLLIDLVFFLNLSIHFCRNYWNISFVRP